VTSKGSLITSGERSSLNRRALHYEQHDYAN
jgi:hypothetical protein